MQAMRFSAFPTSVAKGLPAAVTAPLLNGSLWLAAIGGLTSLAASVLPNPAADYRHPVLWLLVAMHGVAVVAALWRRVTPEGKGAVLLVFCLLWGTVLLVYVGPSEAFVTFAIYCVLTLGLVFGLRALMGGFVGVTVMYALAGWGWTKGVLPLDGSFRDPPHDQANYWILHAVAFFLGAGLICGFVHFLLRRMAQFFVQEGQMQQTLGREQQLRAQAELQRLNEELRRREAEREFASMLRAAPVGIALVRDRHIVNVNDRVGELVRAPVADLIGRHTRELYGSDEAFARVGRALAEAIAANRVMVHEELIFRRDGTSFMGRITASPLDPARPGADLVASLVDVTAERAAAQAVQQSEARLREIFEHTAETIFTVAVGATGNFQVEQVNRRAERYGIAIDPATRADASLAAVFPAQMAGWIATACAQCLATREIVTATAHFSLAQGDCDFAVTLGPILDPGSGQVVRVVALLHDTTAQRRNEELEQSRAAAEAANRAKSVFLSNMSHEIRTPLNAVLGFARVLKRSPNLDARQQEFLGIIDRNGEHLLGLINDILEISKIEASRGEVRKSDFAPGDLVQAVAATFQLKLASRGVSLVVELDPALPALVSGDEGKIRQILVNLVGNAAKFTTTGSVLVRARPTRQGDCDALEFAVVDTGPGISAEEQRGLFRAFEQTEAGRQAGGTGLGLAISRNFARLMGGDVMVESTCGVGSTFRCVVPVIPLRSSPPAPARGTHPRGRLITPDGRPLRVLVADDLPDNRLLLTTVLAAHGIETAEARDGEEAVAMVTTWRPRCVLMDMRMPRLDGAAAIQAIRARHSSAEVCIISLSASVFGEERASFLTAGADAFLPKPVEEDALLATFERLLSLQFEGQAPAAVAARDDAPALETLAPGVAQGLTQAADEADYSALARQIERLEHDGHRGAGRLRELLRRYDYDGIRRMVETTAS